MTLNLPTILTLFRITLIPVVVLVFFLPWDWSRQATAWLFLLAALSDWLDGYMARRLGQTSSFGAFLDPVADKLMVAVVLILLVQAHPTPWFAVPAAVIVGREISISALREWMAIIGHRTQVQVVTIGKVKTVVQMVALFLLLYGGALFLPGYWLLVVAAALTLISMVLYLHGAWPALTQDAGETPGETAPKT